PIIWSDGALESAEEIIAYYEREAGIDVAHFIETQLFSQVEKYDTFTLSAPESEIFPGMRKIVINRLPFVAFIRKTKSGLWEVVDVVHTSRKLPQQ
ncbi:MAG: hypothetical protein RLZZ502_1554, partial [Pseudomonadota bacterium]